MKDRTRFVESARLYLQASDLILSTLPLKHQIQACNSELVMLLASERDSQDRMTRIRELQDEIFGCKIEVQALRRKAQRLIKDARYTHFSELGKKVEPDRCSSM